MPTSAEKMEPGVIGTHWSTSLIYLMMKVPVKIRAAPEKVHLRLSFSIHICTHMHTYVHTFPHIHICTHTHKIKMLKKHTQHMNIFRRKIGLQRI